MNIFDSINQKVLPRTHLLVGIPITERERERKVGIGEERKGESTQWEIVLKTITNFIQQINIFI